MLGDNKPDTLSPEANREFFAWIGRLTISWGHLELGLEGMVEILYRGFKGNTIEPEIPRSLQRKISFLRSSWKRMQPVGVEETEWAGAVNGYLKFLDRVQAAAQTRHDIIHGILVEQTGGGSEAIMGRVTRKRGGDLERKRIHVTTEDIRRAVREAEDLGEKALNWSVQVHELIQILAQQA
jgi:hypothetical protein